MGSIYDYDYEEEEDEPYFYSPADQYEAVEVPDDQQTVKTDEGTLPHRLEDTVYNEAPETIPFYGDTTNKSAYTWKVPTKREERTMENIDASNEKIPFYSETTHRSQYVPIDASVTRTRLSRKSPSFLASNIPLASETTYKNLFQELEIGKRQKLIQTCPAEKLMHRTDLLRKSRRENGHFFLEVNAIGTKSLRPTPLFEKPAQSVNDEK